MGGGMKTPSMPQPQPMPEIDDKVAESEAKLEAERQRLLALNKQGGYGTILTSGSGLQDEPETGQTLLTAKKNQMG